MSGHRRRPPGERTVTVLAFTALAGIAIGFGYPGIALLFAAGLLLILAREDD